MMTIMATENCINKSAASWENQHSAYAKTKAQISFAVTAKLISTFVFATRIVQFLPYLTPKFQASSLLLKLNRSVCVKPVRKPHRWFSHEAAQMKRDDLGFLNAHLIRGRFTWMSRVMRKPDFCLIENKGTADQRLCFRYVDITLSLLFISKISSL